MSHRLSCFSALPTLSAFLELSFTPIPEAKSKGEKERHKYLNAEFQRIAKCLSEEALQIAVKRREVKSKGGKERYRHLNTEFQRIARKDEKAFLSD